MRTPARGGAAQDGMTVAELMITVAMVSISIFVFSKFILSTRRASSRQEASGELLQRNLRTISNLRAGLQGCVELITNYGDSTANGMQNLHAIVANSVASAAASPGGPPRPVGFSTWPTAEVGAMVDLSQDAAGAAAWGDEIMYVAELNSISYTAYYTETGGAPPWHVGGSSVTTTTSAEVVNLSRLQFVYDYLAWDTGTAIAGKGMGLRLVEWRSQPFINYNSLTSFVDLTATCCPRLTSACGYLTSSSYALTFNPFNATMTSNCFYPLTPVSAIDTPITLATNSSLVMGTYSWAYLDDYDVIQSFSARPGVDIGRVFRANGGSGGQISGKSDYSVAFNTISPTTYPSTSVLSLDGPGAGLNVPQYASMASLGTGFPMGFEVGIAGQAGSREVFLRLVLMASNAGTYTAGHFQALQETTEISVAPQADF